MYLKTISTKVEIGHGPVMPKPSILEARNTRPPPLLHSPPPYRSPSSLLCPPTRYPPRKLVTLMSESGNFKQDMSSSTTPLRILDAFEYPSAEGRPVFSFAL